MAARRAHASRLLALALMVASGFAALGYQIVWTQQSALWLGHESAAVLAVVAAFFGGLALGSLALGPRIDRSSKPAHWYVGCEVAIGVWSLALAFVFAPVTGALADLIGAQPAPAWHWFVAFGGTFLLLLPATTAMGATLPAMERILARLRDEGTRIAALYAGNTFGAVLGVIVSAFWLVPELGLTVTASVCAVLNLMCAATAMKLVAEMAADSSTPVQSQAPPESLHRPRRDLAMLAITGLLGIGYEVLIVRVLSQVAENTVYTFAILLAVYLVGTAVGAAAYGRWLAHVGDAERLCDRLLRTLAVACLIGMASLVGAESFKAAVLQTSGPTMAAALGAEAALAMAAFLLPTLVMGALFSHLSTNAVAAGISFGRVLGVNTVGAAIAPLLFGVILVTAIGPKFALLLVAAGYLALSSRRGWSAPTLWATATATLVLAVWAPSLAIIDVPAGGRLVSYAEGPMATVSVIEDAGGVATLHINNRQQEGSSATLLADARQALLPILLHPSPRRALFLGLGTGVTSMSAAEDPTLRVDVVELLPEVIQASAHFTGDTRNPRLHVMAADARRFVRASRERYDVIVSDNFHPARSGSGSLYTVEHFEAVHARLAAEGLFCQWLPLHQLDLDTLRSIVRSFLAIFPNGYAVLATNSLQTPVVGLISRADAGRLDLAQIRNRLNNVATPRSPGEFGIADDLALLGSFIAGPRALARFSGNAPLNTDDHPVVAYRAPRITYAADSLPRDRLIDLLRQVEVRPDELLTGGDIEWASRLAAYWNARNRFIEVGRDVQPTSDVRRMLEQVREPLLSVLHISPDFRPAYDPLLQMATALGSVDVASARQLLIELQQAQPSRPEAAEVLRNL